MLLFYVIYKNQLKLKKKQQKFIETSVNDCLLYCLLKKRVHNIISDFIYCLK